MNTNLYPRQDKGPLNSVESSSFSAFFSSRSCLMASAESERLWLGDLVNCFPRWNIKLDEAA